MNCIKKFLSCFLAVSLICVCLPVTSAETGLEATESKTINLTLGQSYTDIISGADYTGNIDSSMLDTSVAEVSVSAGEAAAESDWQLVSDGAAGIESGKRYIITNTSAAGTGYALTATASRSTVYITDGAIASADDSLIFTLTQNGTGYNFGDQSGTYLYMTGTSRPSLSAGNASPMPMDISGSSSVTISQTPGTRTGYIRFAYNAFSVSTTATTATPLYLFEETVTATEAYTAVTFKGNALGTTCVTVGNTAYTVNVIEEDLSAAESLTLEYWVGNTAVGAETDGTETTSRTVTAAEAYGEAGIALSMLAPTFGRRLQDSGEQATVYWQSRVFAAAGTQTTSTDKSSEGNSAKYIRYYGGTWSYSEDGTAWSSIDTASYQLVAYYLMHIPVTDDIYPAAKDWGFLNGESWGYNDTGARCFLSFRVVYEDGTAYPETDNLPQTTYIYYLGSERYVGYIVLIPGIANTEVYKVTYNMGNAEYSLDRTNYSTSISSFAFEDASEVTLCENADGFTEPVTIDCSSASAPYSELMWNSSYNACLITVYVKEAVHVHEYGEWAVRTAATCREPGLEYRVCSGCGEEETNEIPATGHSYTDEIIAPTCTEGGYTLHTCHCGESFTDSATPALDHSYTETVVFPTEGSAGYTLHTCTACGKSYEDNYTDWNTFPKMAVSDAICGKGKTVIFKVSMENNPGISSFSLGLDYNTSVMSLTAVQISEELGGTAETGENAVWVSDTDTAFGGEFMTLIFTVSDSAAIGEYTVSITYNSGDIADSTGNKVDFAVLSGTLRVIDHIAGDITNDGYVNATDLIRLQKYLAEAEGIEVNIAAADVNNDGVNNNKDLVLLMRYFSGESVEIK